MAKWKVVMVLFALAIVLTNARNVPKEAALKTINDNSSSSNQKNGNVPTHAGLNDQKNFVYGGGVGGGAALGGVTGVLPFCGIGVGVGGGIAALSGVAGLGGASGIGGLGAFGGVGGLGGDSALGGGAGGGVLPLP